MNTHPDLSIPTSLGSPDSPAAGRNTFTTMSLPPKTASWRGSMAAPAARYSSSGTLAATPAPLSTVTVSPFFTRCFTVSGSRATRVSPGMTSFGMPTFMVGLHSVAVDS